MSVILNKEDVPSKEELLQGVSRLRKDAEVLATYRSKKRNDEDPEVLKKLANFLEMLSKKDK